jgi:hypothetical protein
MAARTFEQAADGDGIDSPRLAPRGLAVGVAVPLAAPFEEAPSGCLVSDEVQVSLGQQLKIHNAAMCGLDFVDPRREASDLVTLQKVRANDFFASGLNLGSAAVRAPESRTQLIPRGVGSRPPLQQQPPGQRSGRRTISLMYQAGLWRGSWWGWDPSFVPLRDPGGPAC